ncbi:MAG: hypothetical protein ACI9J2_000591 [Saprospiraceae bacterium]|jgi:uncharacterized protein (DUF934 family)
MQLIKNRALAQSHWQYPDFEDAVNDEAQKQPQVVDGTLHDYRDWLRLDTATKAAVKGLVLQPDVDIDAASEALKNGALANVDIIGIYFPAFTEGRGYTQAAILRNQLHFNGELRAINVYRDNLVLLEDVGFDAFDLHESEDITEALLAFDELDLNLDRAHA